MDLSVVVPAYNEAHRLGDGAARLTEAARRGAVDLATTELVVVDDGSTDDTAGAAGRLYGHLEHFRLLRLPANAGKGAAVRAGVAAARAPAVAFMDADMAIDPWQVPLLVEALADAEVAVGSRTLPGSHVDHDSRARAVMGRAFNRLVNLVTDVGLTDTQCGFKAFRTPVARLLFHCGVVERFAFDVEVLSWARRLGFSVAEVPVQWRHVVNSRIRIVADSATMVRDVARTRLRRQLPPPVAALDLAPAPDGGDVTAGLPEAVADPTLGILATPGGGALVLAPLGDPGVLDAVAHRLAEARRDLTVRRRAVTVAELRHLAPLHLLGPVPAT